jgi:hypothetical protein
MRLNNIIIFFVFIFLKNTINAQVTPDNVWLIGMHEPSGQPGYNNAVIRFGDSTLTITEQDLNMNFESTVASMVDTAGNLLFYTNGCYIATASGDTMQNGNGLNPGEMHDWTCGVAGYVAPFGAMALPMPDAENIYVLLHMGINYSDGKKLSYGPFYYTVIDMNANNGEGAVTSKNNILIDQRNLAPFSAVRHGNGRDWWAIVPEYGTSTYHRVLIDNINVQPIESQSIGEAISCRYIGTGAFSRQGNRYARQHHCGVFTYDFDRCSATFSNPNHLAFPPNAFGGGGVAFTHDGNSVLVSTQMSIMGVDLTAPTPVLDTVVDFLSLLGTSLHLMQHGGDGKIYFSTLGRAQFFHVLKTPNTLGENLGFTYRGQLLPIQNVRTLPNLPNFRLYDFSDSPCDTLGITISTDEKAPPEPLFQISPNPSKSQINIVCRDIQPIMVNIYDMNGRRMIQHKPNLADTNFSIDLDVLPRGTYTIQLIDTLGQSHTRLLVLIN